MITCEEFNTLARQYTVIPLEKTILADLQTPVSVYMSLREEGVSSFLFESVEPDEKIGRFSFVGVNPTKIVRAREHRLHIRTPDASYSITGNVFDFLQSEVQRYSMAPLHGVNGFTGGFVGYVGYDNVKHLENIPLPAPGAGECDDAAFGLFKSVVQFDHLRQRITLVHCVLVQRDDSLTEQYERGRLEVESLELKIHRSSVVVRPFSCDMSCRTDQLPREAFCGAVAKAKRHIVAGDIFQVVLSRRIDYDYTGDLFAVYRALRLINPSPYLFYLDFGEVRLAGSSPEVLVRVQDRVVEVLPIAGTRRRGVTPEEDEALERELLADEKELAEHVMLVDLGRNDVGRVAEFGSVDVPVLKRVERYSHVMHIVSAVRGRLRNGVSPAEALKACFPAGTVSGAPKVRAMELISELEDRRRGIYAGAVGYVGFNDSLDTCIAIRTIVARRGVLSIQTGAGIVADSDPEREYQETVTKAQALLEAVELARRGLTYGSGD